MVGGEETLASIPGKTCWKSVIAAQLPLVGDGGERVESRRAIHESPDVRCFLFVDTLVIE